MRSIKNLQPNPWIGPFLGLLALFVALGGTALALQNNSVRSKHIVNEAVKRADLAPAVRAPKVVVRRATGFAECRRRERLVGLGGDGSGSPLALVVPHKRGGGGVAQNGDTPSGVEVLNTSLTSTQAFALCAKR